MHAHNSISLFSLYSAALWYDTFNYFNNGGNKIFNQPSDNIDDANQGTSRCQIYLLSAQFIMK
jgi:hypothetical protein